MKRNALLTILALVSLMVCAAATSAQKDKDKFKDKNFEPGEQMERSLAASQNVVVSICMSSGDLLIHGWDRPEVKAVATSVRQLELQGGGVNPAQRVEVLASNRTGTALEEPLVSECRAVTDMEINVPRGATVQIHLRAGDIEVSQVAEVRIKNMSGDISLSNITRATEATTISGDVSLANSAGRVRLNAVSGDIDAANIRAVEPGDDFNANSTSGDIILEGVGLARLNANTTNGRISLTGQLARRGSYDFNTISGDVVLTIPPDSAFRVSARAPQGSIATDFAIKSTGDTDAQNLLQGGRLTGTYGAGDWANLNINSFSGTVRLQKR
jgi:hypothetical protein